MDDEENLETFFKELRDEAKNREIESEKKVLLEDWIKEIDDWYFGRYGGPYKDAYKSYEKNLWYSSLTEGYQTEKRQ